MGVLEMLSRSGLGRMWLAAAALMLLGGALACDPGFEVEYDNATSQRVTVYKDGTSAFSLEPYEVKATVGFEKDWRPDIKVVGDDGRVLLEDHITLDELEKVGYKIVITDPAHPPSPTPPLVRATATPVWPTPPPAACWGKGPQSPLAPSPPTNLRAELVSSPLALEGQLVRLQWDDNADDDLCYVIEKKITTEDWSIYEAVGGAPPSDTGAVSTDIVPLELGVHCYRMYLGNEEGRSAYSNEVCLDVQVLPRIATPTPGPFEPWPFPEPPTPAPPPATPVVPTYGLPPDCRVEGRAGAPGAPNPPSNLTISLWSLGGVAPAFGPSIIEFGWDDNSDNESCFVLMFEGPWIAWEGMGPNETVFNRVLLVGEGSPTNEMLFNRWLDSGDGSPTEGSPENWCYHVFAANQEGRSEASNQVCLYLKAPLPTVVPTPATTPAQPQFAGPERSSTPAGSPTPTPGPSATAGP